MKKLIYLVTAVFFAIVVLTGCGTFDRPQTNAARENFSDGLKVYTTFYPLYDFTKKIAGEKAYVENIVPTGAEPHNFEPTPKAIVKLYDAGIFVFLGEPMDPWAKKIEAQLKNKGVVVVEAGEGLIQNNDPHIWLDPIMAKQISRRICNALVQADAANKDYYESNLIDLEARFDELDAKYQTLAQMPQRDIITSHDFLGYLAKRYNLNSIAITGLSPQSQPSGNKMREIATLAKEKKIKTIFYETLTNPKLAESLAQEAGVKTMTLNPVAGLTEEELKAGEDYFSIMEKNLEALKAALSE